MVPIPWHVAKTSQCPTSKPWGVIKDATGDVIPGGCHESKKDAEAHMAALYANEPAAKGADMGTDCGCSGRTCKKINPDYTEGAAMAPAQVRELRRASLNDDRRALSGPAARLEPFRAQWRSAPPQMRDGVMMTRLDGYASVTGIEYEMWDAFGPYGETVDGGAFGKTLAANPDVAFLTNHRGLTMARTLAREGRQPTLLLDADPRGLHCEAWVNQERSDVHDLVLGIDDGNITEMSFGFYITGAEWDEDYEHFRILEVDIHRGDVSAVNYGANPYTDIAARSRTIMSELSHLPAGAQRAAVTRLQTALHWRQDTDDEVTALVAGLDATLDQASALVGGDTAGLPDNIAQALALLTAAEEIADELMDKLGINDPDEAGENELAARRPGASVRARLAHLTRSTTGRSVEYYSSMLDLEGYKEKL